VPAMGADHNVNMVVEIPAGSAQVTVFNPETGLFEVELSNNQPRTIDFLPFPANFGFIPSTELNQSKKAINNLPVLLLSESLPTATLIKIIPISVVKTDDHGELNQIIIAVPADAFMRILTSVDFAGLEMRYPDVITIIERWLMSYTGNDTISIIEWGDEMDAMSLIASRMKK
jgi:inorganic pyrophosphatase